MPLRRLHVLTILVLGLGLIANLARATTDCRVIVAGLPFRIPDKVASRLANHQNFLPQRAGSRVPGWVHEYLSGGKRLRPLMVYLSAMAMGRELQDVDTLAAIVELIHLGSLSLDDIIDEAQDRRGKPPLYLGEGMLAGLITAPWLQAYAYRLAEPTHSVLRDVMTETLLTMADAEVFQRELKLRGAAGQSYTEEEYYKVAMGKTGVLFGFSAAISAIHARPASEMRHTWERLGQMLGVTYQMRDDFEDALSEPQEINYALLMAAMADGGSPFRQLEPGQLQSLRAVENMVFEQRRKAMLGLLDTLQVQINGPKTAEQAVAMETLRDMVNYVAAPLVTP